MSVTAGTYFIETLGCPKNTADSETIEARLLDAGFVPARRARNAGVVVVNTCGFIQAAREESIASLLDHATHKRAGQVVIGAGCLTGRYLDDIRSDIPELDAVVGVEAWDQIAAVVAGHDGAAQPAWLPRRLDRQDRHSAFLKIADGCSAPCSFCSIPKFKGLWRSKPASQILDEARALVASGVKELVLVSQDSSAWGYDLGERDALAGLIEQLLAAVPDVHWLRLMYVYPGHVTQRLADVMGSDPRIAHYIDIPLQHAHPEVLRRMKRPSVEVARRTIERVRTVMPDAAIRTAFIVGSPGETEGEFQALLDFLDEQQFDRAGVFTYSQEEGTPMALLPDQLPERIKRQRLAEAMKRQEAISLRLQQRLVGQELTVLIDGVEQPAGSGARAERGRAAAGRTLPMAGGRTTAAASPPTDAPLLIGRSYRDAPDVDGLVLVRGAGSPGDLLRVRVTEALAHDLVAVPVHPA